MPRLTYYIPHEAAPQQLEKRADDVPIEGMSWWQLHQYRPQFRTELTALSEKTIEEIVDAQQSPHMCDLLRHLHCKAKPVGYGRGPASIGCRTMRAVE